MVHRMSGEIWPYEQKRNSFQKKINYADCSNCSDDEENMVGLAEWVQNNKKPISSPFGKKEPEKFGFDITKADKIFDLLLSEGQIKLKPYHKIPSDEELKHIKYCKWHNATSHDTNECKVFCQQIQSAIEQGRLKFEVPKRPMKMDQHPFATNMVDIGGKKNALQTKVLTSPSAKESGAVDSKSQITADEVKGKKLQEEAECSAAPQRRVTSQMLLNKFQRDREKQQYREEAAQCNEEHWKCPFFVHCWEEVLTLPSADYCPECNGLYSGSRSYKKPHFDNGPRGPIIRERHEYRKRIPAHDQLGGTIPAHDRLGGRIPVHDWLGAGLC